MTIIWCSEFLGDLEYPYPSSSGTIAYNIVTRLLDRKININVADPRATRHRSFITPLGKSLGRLYATYDNRDLIDLVSRLKPEKIVADDLGLASLLLTIPNIPEIVLIAHSPEIPNMIAEGLSVVAVSMVMRDSLKDRGIESTYIPLAADPELFRKTSAKKKGFVFGCVTRNKAEKNLYRLLEAYRLFNEDFKDAAALAIHTDAGVWDVRWMAKKLGIQDNVFFGNWPADQGAMVRIYNTFDVHINIGGREWSALPVLESMSCGIPQIASDYGVLREYAQECGVLVPNKTDFLPIVGEIQTVDSIDLCQAMGKIWLNEADRVKAGEAAMKKAKTYSWDKSANEWENLLSGGT